VDGRRGQRSRGLLRQRPTRPGSNPREDSGNPNEAYSYDAAGNTTWQQQGTTNTFYKNDRNHKPNRVAPLDEGATRAPG
jgi:hypothetical protein